MPLAAKFAHLTDVHLPIPKRPALGDLLNKRALGYLSWRRRRFALHRAWAAEALAADIAANDCQAALLTGDMVNIALPAEFRQARSWLEERFRRTPVIFTPGNHDTYVRTNWNDTLGLLAPYMTGRRCADGADRAPRDFSDFPFTRALPGCDQIAVIAVNTSPTTAPGLASGAVGRDQLERVRTALADAGSSGRFRVLMIHHPINDGVVSARKALDDRKALRDVIAEAGVELVLHGHAHVAHIGTVATPYGEAPVAGGGSASHPAGHGRYRPARYNLFTLTQAGDFWSLEIAVRELNPGDRSVSTVETLKFDLPAAKTPAAATA